MKDIKSSSDNIEVNGYTFYQEDIIKDLGIWYDIFMIIFSKLFYKRVFHHSSNWSQSDSKSP